MLLNALQARDLFRLALERRFAILAVNADSPAAVLDCLEAARQADAPILIETSLWQLTGHSFGSGDPILGLTRYLAELNVLANSDRFKDVPVVFHTDHIKGPRTLDILGAAIRGVRFGLTDQILHASTISLDSSEMTEAENIDHICQLAAIAADAGVPLTLEMEAGVDDGVTEIEVADHLLSPIEEKHPGLLALWAPGVGTQHGLGDSGYPFSVEAVAAHRARASEICGRPIGIALHGSSGLAASDLKAGVEAGVAKVNWSSESLLIRSQAAQEFFATHGEQLQKGHKQWKATAMDNGLQTFVSSRYIPKVVDRIAILNGTGQAAAVREVV